MIIRVDFGATQSAQGTSKCNAHDGAAVSVYRGIHKFYGPINGDGVKTWGLTVDGQEIQSVDDALFNDQILAFGVMPILGIAMFTFAIFDWKKKEERDE